MLTLVMVSMLTLATVTHVDYGDDMDIDPEEEEEDVTQECILLKDNKLTKTKAIWVLSCANNLKRYILK